MTKEKLSSNEKLTSTEVSTAANYGYRRVSDWTKKELAELQQQKSPICVELATGDYIVGKFTVQKVTKTCWRVRTVEFSDKRCAIFYCVLLHLGNTTAAEELCDLDWKVSKLDLDKEIYRIRLDAAHLMDDQFKVALYGSRYEDAKDKLKTARLDLEKNLKRAKYLNS